MADNSEQLRQEFDRRLGRRSAVAKAANRPKSKKSQQVEQTAHIRANAGRPIRQKISTGQQSIPTELKKAFQQQFGPKTAGGGRNAANNFQRTMNNIVDEAVREANERAATERAIMKAMENPADSPVEKSQKREMGVGDYFKAAISSLPGVGDVLRGGKTPLQVQAEALQQSKETGQPADYWQGLMEGFSRSPVGRALDVVSRPAYGVFEGMDRALEAGYDRDEDFWHSFDDLGEGFAAGITGKEKTGFGQVWNRMRDNSEMVGFDELRNLEESHPGVTRWIDRGAGLAGELAFDPLNWVGGGSAGIIRNTGERATENTIKASIRDVVDTATRDFYDDTVVAQGGLRYKPSQDALAQYAAQAAEDAIEKNLLEINAGTHAGWGKMGTEATAQSTAARVTEEVKRRLFSSFDNRIDKVTSALSSGGNLPINSWRTHMAQSPELGDVIDLMMSQSKKAWASRDQFIASLTKADIPRIQKAAQEVKGAIDSPLYQYVTDEVLKQARQLTYNTIGIRVGNKTVPIKTIGKAYAYGRENLPLRAKAGLDNFGAHMSYERNFPGRLSLLTQANRSIGAKAFETFRDEWSTIARELTDEQDKLLFRALDGDNTVVLTPELQVVANKMRQAYDEIFAEEVAMGSRPDRPGNAGPGSRHGDDYVYLFTKGGKYKDRAAFKKGRKAAYNSTGRPGGYSVARAKADGLKPVESAVEALLLRKLKSTRDITRSQFLKDLVENYGISTKFGLTDATKRQRQMVEVTRDRLPNYLRAEYDKGNKFYLPEHHAELFKRYDELSKWDSKDQEFLLNNIRKLTNVIKYISTVPRPGFHVRNFIGDIFMGLLDDVPVRTYREVLTKYIRNSERQPASFRISANISKTWDEFKALYDTHANSGFFETELPLGGSTPTAGQHLQNARKRVAGGMRDVSDAREDLGRMVHFLSAFRQETAALIKKGYKGTDLEQRAIEAAVWRVNHYKFDYGALTATERKIKMLFPFYTFTRKAAPTLLQQLFLNPKWMSLPNRFMTYNDGSAADKFNHYFLPEYVKDMGYGMLNNEGEPLYITNDILPTSVLNSLDFTNMQQFGQSVTQQMNPLAQIPFEITFGEQIFSGQKTGSFPEYMMNKFSIPGQFVRQVAGDDSEPQWLQTINESWMGAGIPVRQFTQPQQDFGFRQMEDKFIQDPFSEFNRSQELYRVYQSNRAGGTSFRVANAQNGQVLFETMNPTEALAYAQKIAG